MDARSVAGVTGAVALLAVALLAMATGAPAATAAEAPDHAEVRTDTVEGLTTARDAAGAAVVDRDPEHTHDGVHVHAAGSDGAASGLRSETLTPSMAFSMVGFSVPEGAAVSFRHRQLGEEWSEWNAVAVHPGERPDRDADEAGPERDAQGRAVSLPAWTGAADELQVLVDGAHPEDLAVHLVDGLGQDRGVGERISAAVDTLARTLRPAARPAAAAVAQPDVVTRSQWGARPSGSPSYAAEARGAVMHHTVTSNAYSRADAPAVVRSIQSYHIDHQGWKDIGYNFLIDRYGTIYEGRAGGVTRAVIGAHAAGHNTGSIGVAFLGQHQSGVANPAYGALSDAAQHASVELLSWLFDVHGIDARATGTLPSGYTYPSWASRIVGHGSVGSTSCPGSSVNDRLADVRAGVLDAQQPADDADPDDTDADTDGGDGPRGDEPGGDDPDAGGDTDDTDDPDAGGDTDDPTTPGGDDGGSGSTLSTLERLAGSTRQATSVAIAQESHYRAATVVIASARDYPDALAGAGLAGQLDAPVLLTGPDHLDAVVADEVARLEADRAVLLGSDAALHADVAADLAALGLDVERTAGADRFATAAAIAGRLDGADTVVIANGVHGWPDAVAASQLAARRRWPVLLTATEELPKATVNAVADLAPDRILVIGGPSMVAPDVAERLDAHAEVVRVAGPDRLGTADAVLDHAVQAGADPRSVWLASAGDWPDALSAGPAAARRGDALLLTWPDRLASDGQLAARLEAARDVLLVGGPAAISSEVEHDAAELLGD